MKHSLFLALSFSILCTCSTSHAAEPTSGSGNGNKRVAILKVPTGSSSSVRPNAPSRQQIDCIYLESYLYFNFAIPEGQCLITVTETTTGEEVKYIFDSSSDAAIYVGELHQAYIKLSTAKGNIYGGVIEL